MADRAKLESFIGKWNTTGRVVGSTSPIEIRGFDTYEWLPGRFFMMHKVNVLMGNNREESLEIIGYDEKTATFPMHFFDSRGNSGVMEGSLHSGVWTFLSATMRFTGRFTDNENKLSGIWEQSTDGARWIPWMEIHLKRVKT